MITFNDSFSKFYQCSIWGFCQGISMFFSICLGKKEKKMLRKIFSNLKKYLSKNKMYVCLKKSNVSLNKKVIFVFHMIFKLDFVTHHLLLSTDVCILFWYFFCSLISSVSKKRNIETMLTLHYSYNSQKYNNKMNEKRSQEHQSINPEYVTGEINSRSLELLLRPFCRLIFAPSRKF